MEEKAFDLTARGCPLLWLDAEKSSLCHLGVETFTAESLAGAEIIPPELERYHERVRRGYEIFVQPLE